MIDGDDECLKRPTGRSIGPELVAQTRTITPHIPLAVVVANREYEAWFLADFHSLRDRKLLPAHARLARDIYVHPEVPRDCKGLIAGLLGCSYEERVHQHQLTNGMTLSPRVIARSPSYGKLLRDLERLTHQARRRLRSR